jgi:hypothetical protein
MPNILSQEPFSYREKLKLIQFINVIFNNWFINDFQHIYKPINLYLSSINSVFVLTIPIII